MSTIVQIVCDEKLDGHIEDGDRSQARCWSNANIFPEGTSVAIAKAQARKQGWRFTGKSRDYAVCPGCQVPTSKPHPTMGRPHVNTPVSMEEAVQWHQHYFEMGKDDKEHNRERYGGRPSAASGKPFKNPAIKIAYDAGYDGVI